MDNYGEIFDSYLMHYGTPGMHWRTQGPGKRYQSHAVYAQGRPNPDAKVRGTAKDRMSITHPNGDTEWSAKNMTVYPEQKLSDFSKLTVAPNYSIRRGLNHPDDEEGLDAGRHYNCPNCAMAFEMMERGYDVIARPAVDGSNVGDIERFVKNGRLSGTGVSDISRWESLNEESKEIMKRYKEAENAAHNAKGPINSYKAKQALEKVSKEMRENDDDTYDEITSLQMKTADNTNQAILSQGPSARGVIVVGWMNDYTTPSDRTTSYHAFNYKNENGEVKFYDVQSRRMDKYNGFSLDDAKNGFFRDIDPRDVYIMRTDNRNITDNVTKAVYSPKRDDSLKHALEVFDSYLMHYGTPGMHWRQQGPGKRYQSHAVYAQGRPNPDAKVRGQKDSKSKLNDLIKNGQMKSVGVSNIKGWESAAKNLYNSAKKEKSDDKLTKGTDNLFREIDRLRKQASDNAEKMISSQGSSSSGTIAVRNLYDRYSPERTAESYSSYFYKNENGSIKYYKTGSDKEVGKDTVFSDFDPRGVYVSRSNDKQQASAGAGKSKVEVLSKKAFNDLPPKDRVRMHTDAALGKNYEFNKKIRDAIQNEKDGSNGRIDAYMPTRGPAQLNWEKANGKVVFREPLFNRKVSDKYADKVLNRSMFGGYTRK